MIDNVNAELDAVCTQLDAVRRAVALEVESTWTSPWKSPDTVDAKVAFVVDPSRVDTNKFCDLSGSDIESVQTPTCKGVDASLLV